MIDLKLQPPVLNDVLVPCTSNILNISFIHNSFVDIKNVKLIRAKIKTIVTNKILETLDSESFDLKNGNVNFILDAKKYEVGNYYKIQIAYIDENHIEGYYSTVATFKITVSPKAYIKGLRSSSLVTNPQLFEYYGIYEPSNEDASEIEYSYKFIINELENGKWKEFFNTGDLIHNNEYKYDLLSCPKRMDLEKDYTIQYQVRSINGIEIKTPKYKLSKTEYLNNPLLDDKFELNIHQDLIDIEYGRVKIDLNCPEEIKSKTYFGKYKIIRLDSEGGFLIFTAFSLQDSNPSGKNWIDYTVENGKEYWYYLIQYNSMGLQSKPLISNQTLKIGFESMYLYDGQKQLCIKFNPKVSSFKTVLQDSKTETLGNKYPYFFRNGVINYKEFPIEGLLTYELDIDNHFISMPHIETLRESTMASNNNNNNNYFNSTKKFFNEKQFKNNVLDWLNDGKIKLFRSPTEGNFLVRLMSVSLSPIDSIGRMLHSFQATAVEAEEINYNNFQKYKFLPSEEVQDYYIELNEQEEIKNINLLEETKLEGIIEYLYIETLMPHQKFIIVQEEKPQVVYTNYLNGTLELDNINISQISWEKMPGVLTAKIKKAKNIENEESIKIKPNLVQVPVQQFSKNTIRGYPGNILDLIYDKDYNEKLIYLRIFPQISGYGEDLWNYIPKEEIKQGTIEIKYRTKEGIEISQDISTDPITGMVEIRDKNIIQSITSIVIRSGIVLEIGYNKMLKQQEE